MKLKVGDKVKGNPDCGLVWEKEEIELERTYEVLEIGMSHMFGPYVQLKGVLTAYAFDWLILVKRGIK